MCVCVCLLQDPAIVHWVNSVLLQSLDPILLPVYLDVLQVLKAKVRTAVPVCRLEAAEEEGGGVGVGQRAAIGIPCAFWYSCAYL